MSLTNDGWVPDPAVLERFLAATPLLTHPDVPDFQVIRHEPLLDSSNTRPEDWVELAASIVAHDAEFDAFVVLHGTDTMAYTASALSFLLDGLNKPVILTGAQLSLEHVMSDGRDHLVTALVLAGQAQVPEVCILFGSVLLRGNRAQKVSNDEFMAFESGNLPPLAHIGARIKVNHGLVRVPRPGPVRLRNLVRQPEVVALRVFPGISAKLVERVLRQPTEGVVMATYGTGNFPSNDQALLDALAEGIARGVVVVNISQCHRGRVSQRTYGTGTALDRIGVVSGADMTAEAALTKLYCLLGQGLSPTEVARRMTVDLAGEMTPERLEEGTPALMSLPSVEL
ncbi:MAG: asparaginase [Myxococcales bacterium]|nr:asparaginase [Myxococcales bacterium]